MSLGFKVENPSLKMRPELINLGLKTVNPDAFALTDPSDQVMRNNDVATKTAIFKIIIEHYDFHPEQLTIRTRKRPFVEARQLAHYLLKNRTDYSLAVIGKMVGGYDHATVLHSSRVWDNFIFSSRRHRLIFDTISKRLDGLLVGKCTDTVKVKRNERTIRNWKKYKHEFYTIQYGYDLKVS